MSNKGKKKQGKIMSLGEFHAATESSSSGGGGGGASLGGGGGGIGGVPASVGQTVRINWADEMEKLDDSAPTDFVFDRSKLPTAAKSNLAPDFDLESVPKQPPFTAFISNVSFEADEAKIRGFFRDSSILNVRLPLDERGRFKGQGYIDFADRESLITALQRNEESFFNRAMKVVLESKSRHYGGRGGANDTGERASDEADWRSRPAPRDQESSGGPLKSYSFHNDPMRQGGGNPRYQNREGGGGVGGGSGGGGYQRRNNYNNSNYNNNRGGDGQNAWQHSNNRDGGRGGGEYHQGDRPPRRNNYQKFEGGHQRRNEGEQREHRESGGEQEKQQPTSTPTSPPEGPSERPKLKLAPRTLPVAEEPDAQASASAIFGSARPVNTAARERMIEEKLQREREAKAKADAAAAAAAAADAEATPEPTESETQAPPVAEQLQPTSPPQQQQHGGNRSHKTSVSSDHKDSAGEFHTVGGHQPHYGGRGGGRGGADRRPYKNEGGRGDRGDGNRQQRLTPSESFTSGGNKYQNTRQPYHNKPRGGEHSGGGGGHYQQHDRVHRGHDESSSGPTQHQRSGPTENPWKTKSAAADLFSGSNAGATTTVGDSPSSNRGSARTSESHPAAVEQDAERSPASHHQHQRRVNTNTNNSNRLDRKPHGSGDFQNSRGGPRGDNNNRRGNYNNNNRGGGKQLGRQGGGGERDKVSEKREYQPRPPRDFASVAAAPQTKQETGLNNKFAGLAIDVEDVDYDNDNDEEEEEEDEELEHEDDEQHQKEQHVDA